MAGGEEDKDDKEGKGEEGKHTEGISDRSTKWDGLPPLPYLNNLKYLKTLDRYVSSKRLNSTLIVWGAKSVAKSGGLQLKMKEWISRGDVVIDVDLKSTNCNMAKFTKIFREAVLKGLGSLELELEEVKRLETNHQRQRESEQITRAADKKMQEIEGRTLRETLAWSWRALRWSLGWATPADIQVVRGMTATAKILTAPLLYQLPASTPEDVIHVLHLLEAAAKQTDRRIIIVLREVQELDAFSEDQKDGERLFELLFQEFGPRKQGKSLVPFIIETSGFMWARVRELLENDESFWPHLVGGFLKDDLERDLVERTFEGFDVPVFTKAEFEEVWEFSGGHQGTVYTLFDRLSAGHSLHDAMEEMALEKYSKVQALVVQGSQQEVLAREAFLTQLVNDPNCRLATKGALTDPPALYLLKHNILFFDGRFVTPQHALFEKAIREYVGRYMH